MSKKSKSKMEYPMKKILIYLAAGITFGLVAASTLPGIGRDAEWMYIHIQGNYEPGQEIVGSLSGRNFTYVDMELIRVDLEEVMTQTAKKGSSYYLKDLELKKAKTVKEWKIDVKKDEENDWINQELTIENPGVGVYIIQATTGDIVRTQMIIISGIATVVKSDDRRMVVFVADRRTGEAKAGADVVIVKQSGDAVRAKTGPDGMAKFDIDTGEQRPVLAFWKEHAAAVNAYFYGGSDYEKNKIYVYTDRPVYRPDQKVLIKGIVRTSEDEKYSVPTAGKIKLTISDPRGNEVLKVEPELSDFGTFKAEYRLGAEPPLGRYNVMTEINGLSYYSSFNVEEYRKPEYEITVTAARDTLVQGDPLLFNLKAAYYFGEPVKDATVQYTLYRRRVYRYWYTPYSWYRASSSRVAHYSYGYGDEAARGGGKTDGAGNMQIIFSDTKADEDLRYTLVAKVTEKGRREVEGIGTASVMRGEFTIETRADRYMAAPGEKAWILTKASDIDGAPVSRALDLLINRIDWKDEKRAVKKVYETTIETSSTGEARTPFTPDEDGYFEIIVSGKDGRGNTISDTARLYVASGGRHSYYSSQGIELILDKEQYAPGDEARLLINSQMGDVPALLTLEGARMLDARVIELKNGTGYYTFKITPEFQPNTEISVCIIKDNQLQQISATLVAPPVDKFLTVTITSDKGIYKPGEKARVKIEAKDNNGSPADTELSLGAVDESIYAISPEETQDIRAFFYGPRGIHVSTQTSFWFYTYGNEEVQKASEPMAAYAPGEGGRETMKTAMAEDKELVQPEIRSDFPDTAYWGPQIRTGEDGVAEVEFAMPDTLTTWRLTSRGVTRDTSVGETTYKVISRKNLIVRLETPRFFTQDDTLAITAVVHNYLSAEKEVHAVLNVKGIKLLESNEKVMTVPAGGDVRVEWRAVVESPQNAWITVKALTDEESDAMQLTIPVLPHGTPVLDAAAGEVGEKKDFTLDLKKNYVGGTQKLTITLAPSLTAGMFDSLEYLAGYPYGCVEQTMSRFLPDVVIARALQEAGRTPTGKLTELPKMVADGFNRLADMQHEDGAWGWWKTDKSDPYMTAYVIFGLSQAKQADFEVPQQMFERGVKGLLMLLSQTEEPDKRAYMVFALAEAGAPQPEIAKKIFSNRKKLSIYGKAALAIACKKSGLGKEAAALVRDLEKSAVNTKTTAYWKGQEYRYRWTDNPVETTAYAIMALIECDPKNPLISKAVRYLNISRRGDRWYSTKDTALALMALTRYMSKYEDPRPDYNVTVKVNGEQVDYRYIGVKDVDAAGARIEITDRLHGGKNTVSIEKNGKGSLYYFASLDYYESADGEIGALDKGIRVERYFSWDVDGKKRIKSKTRLKSGDKIWAQIKIVAKNPYEYAVVENYLPSGFEVDKTEWERVGGVSYWTNREIRDEKTVFFINYFWNKEQKYVVPLTAETPGEVAAMPCVASLMYFPDVYGRSTEVRFTVTAAE